MLPMVAVGLILGAAKIIGSVGSEIAADYEAGQKYKYDREQNQKQFDAAALSNKLQQDSVQMDRTNQLQNMGDQLQLDRERAAEQAGDLYQDTFMGRLQADNAFMGSLQGQQEELSNATSANAAGGTKLNSRLMGIISGQQQQQNDLTQKSINYAWDRGNTQAARLTNTFKAGSTYMNMYANRQAQVNQAADASLSGLQQQQGLSKGMFDDQQTYLGKLINKHKVSNNALKYAFIGLGAGLDFFASNPIDMGPAGSIVSGRVS